MHSGLDADHLSFRARRRFGSLDGVRCLAIVAVVWHHANDIPYQSPFARGFLGVDLFFVLSGFLIVTLLLREREEKGEISLRNFYVRRSLRIFPAYYGLLACLAGLHALRPNLRSSANFFQVLPNLLTYTSNWVHGAMAGVSVLWSLATEEQFYLLWPAVERFLPPRLVWLVLALGLAANQAINFGLLDDAWRSATGTEPDLEILDATYTPILLGVLLAHLMHRPSSFRLVGRIAGARWSPLVWGAALLAAIALAPSDISGAPRLLTQLLMTVWLASLVSHEDHVLARILEWPLVARLGAISYGMYLIHMFTLQVTRELQDRVAVLQFPGALFLLGLLVTAVAAELSFRYFEAPFLRLKTRFEGGSRGKGSTP